jgi:hypothetical protein
MPYKDPEKKKAHDRLRAEKARIRRAVDPEFAKKERESRKRWYEAKYKTDAVYRALKNKKRVVMRYGMALKDYEKLLESQNNMCLICHTKHEDQKGKRLVIDHDHQKDIRAVRGLLCGTCNLGLGLFKDNPTLLRNAATYLEHLE